MMFTGQALSRADAQDHAIAPELSECLLRTVESAAQARRRYQYFLWTQGDMQRLLPHKLSVCGVYDRHRRDMSFEVFYSVPVPSDALADLSNGYSSLMRQLLDAWYLGRQQPVAVGLETLPEQDATAELLVQAGYRHLLVHAVHRPSRPKELESFFVFGSPDAQPESAAKHALSLLIPYLHSTYQRVHVTERELGASGVTAPAQAGEGGTRGAVITAREREVLRWVREGLSNQQISEKMGISALTVKNHVQKILRKLDASNRTQAVAKAMAANAFGAGPDISG